MPVGHVYVQMYPLMSSFCTCNLQEQGHLFTIGDVSRVIYCTLVAVSADNLGSCALGGFKEGSTAYRGCRHALHGYYSRNENKGTV